MTKPRNRILIVDDEKVNITVLVALLEDDYDIIVAKSGEMAIQRANSEFQPDLILLDVIMPGMDGYTVCHELKNQSSTKNIPIIFITVKGTEEEETKGLAMGAVDYISKPFSPSIVKARVANHIELKRQRDLLESLNHIDGLTGISNRRRFDEFLDLQLKLISRTPNHLSLLMIDVDHFKEYNDHYGHLQGDDCLKKIAQCLSATAARSTDLVARYGGEEFAIILPNTNQRGAIAIGQSIISAVQKLEITHEYSAVAEYVSISVGATTLQYGEEMSSEEMIRQADQALYNSKENGRNQATSYSKDMR